MARAAGFAGRHKLMFVAILTVLILASGTSVWALQYDDRGIDRLLEGTVIEGVDVGELDFAAAIGRLRQEVEAPLHRPVNVRVGDFTTRTTPWELGLRVDVPAAVAEAMERSQSGGMPTRVWRRLFGGDPEPMSLTPAWGEGRMDELLARAGEAIAVEPTNASIDYSTGWISIAPERQGRMLDLERSRQLLLEAVKLGDEGVHLTTSVVEPEVKAADFSKVILVRAGENTLHLYENGTVVKSWPVATGTAQFATPKGLWRVVNKQVNPTWINPGSAWAKSMPARIGPGPNNPLGTHALGLNAPGILIHATSDRSSIGFSASHGCVRMLAEHEIELFNMVPVGTPVAIVQAAPPKPRGSAPAPADATQAATVQF